MSRYTEYKKRRIINFKQRVEELELENKNLRSQLLAVTNEATNLKSDMYYLETQIHRSGSSIRPRR